MVVQANPVFIAAIDKRLSKHGEKTQLLKKINIGRTSLWRFLNSKRLKKNTAECIIRAIVGEEVNIDDYIKPL